MTLVLTAGVQEEYIPEVHYFFDVLQSDELNAESDITDHYVENNTAVQDHVSLKPLEFTVRGLIGEKVYNRDYLKATGVVETALDSLKPIGSFLPSVSNYAQVAINATFYVESSVKRYKSSFDKIFKNKTQSAVQEQICNNLLELRANRTLMSLYVDNLGKFDNLLIKSARITQEDSIYASQLIVELKQYNSVSTQTTKVDIKKYAARCGQQQAYEENLGKVQGVGQDRTSTLYRWTYGGGQ